jgi:hypothetical protein
MRHLFGFRREGDGGHTIISGTSLVTIIYMDVTHRRVVTNSTQNGLANGLQLAAYYRLRDIIVLSRLWNYLETGSKAMQLIFVDGKFCIKIDELKKVIDEDRKNGLSPFCTIGNADMFNLYYTYKCFFNHQFL